MVFMCYNKIKEKGDNMDIKFNAEKNREFFNRKIDEYDDTHAKFMETKKELEKNLPKDSKHILDLGVGTGLELIEIFKKHPDIKVTAIDISENMLERLKEREFSKNINIICGNFFEVDFGNGYDAVISTSALHHFLKKDKLVLYRKIYDSLKDGGEFINSDKIVETDEEEEAAIKDYNENINVRPHIDTPLSIDHEVEVLEEVGFKDIEVSTTDQENYRLIKARK